MFKEMAKAGDEVIKYYKENNGAPWEIGFHEGSTSAFRTAAEIIKLNNPQQANAGDNQPATISGEAKS